MLGLSNLCHFIPRRNLQIHLLPFLIFLNITLILETITVSNETGLNDSFEKHISNSCLAFNLNMQFLGQHF